MPDRRASITANKNHPWWESSAAARTLAARDAHLQALYGPLTDDKCNAILVEVRRDGRAVECDGLENRRGASLPGFESQSLRRARKRAPFHRSKRGRSRRVPLWLRSLIIKDRSYHDPRWHASADEPGGCAAPDR